VKYDSLLKLIGLVVASLLFFYSTFATIDYVDAKHQQGMDLLKDIHTRIVRIEDFLLNQKGR
jgi:hypothetical protein